MNDTVLQVILMYSDIDTIKIVSSFPIFKYLLNSKMIKEKIKIELPSDYKENNTVFRELINMGKKRRMTVSNSTFYILFSKENFKDYAKSFHNISLHSIGCNV